MAERFDVYSDQVGVQLGPYGASLNFAQADPHPVVPGTMPKSVDLGTVRMSLEHWKVMTFLFKRQLQDLESQLGMTIPIGVKVLNGLQIAPEDWDKFWKRD